MQRLVVYVSLFLVAPLQLSAQKVFSTYPFQFDQIFQHQNIINPAVNLPDNKNLVQVGYNGFSALSNNLSTYYLNLRYSFGRDSFLKRHTLGLFVIDDKEGEYLNRFKLMGQYAYSVSLSQKTTWTSGASFGFVNNSLKPNSVVGGASAYSIDGDIGTWLRHNNLYGGISINQLFNNNIRFLNGTYNRKRHISFMGGYERELGLNFVVKLLFYGRTGPELYNKYVLGSTFIIKDIFLVGIQGKTGNGLVPLIGVQKIPFLKNSFCFLFSYRIPTSKYILSGTGNSEILLEYKF